MKYKVMIGVFAAVLLIGILGSVWVLLSPHGETVNIVQDGKILYTFDLSTADDQIINVEYEGRTNSVQIENGRIRVLEAECPDNTCVHMGWLESGTLPIVCLPNHLVIEFAEANSELDAVVQ